MASALGNTSVDEHNRALLANVHPADWINPEPAPRYNLVVVGAGTAGLVTAAGAAILGAKVAIVERDLMGGDCLNFGCVPSKALIRSARAAAEVRDAARFGVDVPDGARVDFAAVMERMRQLRAGLSANDSAARFRGLGADVFIGDARFVARDTVEVDGKRLRFRKAAIATGARAGALPIPGLAETGFLTNESVFSLTELPRRIAVIGAGPIGCELAQTFRRFGAEVTLLEVMPQILIREDRDAAQRIERALTRDGVDIVTDCQIRGVAKHGADKSLAVERPGQHRILNVDEILIGVGRVPAVAGPRTRGGRRRVRPAARHQGRRLSAHHQPPHLRRRRRRLGAQVHPSLRRARAHPAPQRAVLRPPENQRADHPVVHLHRSGNRARRTLRSAGACGRHQGHHLSAGIRRGRSRAHRRRDRRLRQGARARRNRSDRRRHDRRQPCGRDDLGDDHGDDRENRPRKDRQRDSSLSDPGRGDQAHRVRVHPHAPDALRRTDVQALIRADAVESPFALTG